MGTYKFVLMGRLWEQDSTLGSGAGYLEPWFEIPVCKMGQNLRGVLGRTRQYLVCLFVGVLERVAVCDYYQLSPCLLVSAALGRREAATGSVS